MPKCPVPDFKTTELHDIRFTTQVDNRQHRGLQHKEMHRILYDLAVRRSTAEKTLLVERSVEHNALVKKEMDPDTGDIMNCKNITYSIQERRYSRFDVFRNKSKQISTQSNTDSCTIFEDI